MGMSSCLEMLFAICSHLSNAWLNFVIEMVSKKSGWLCGVPLARVPQTRKFLGHAFLCQCLRCPTSWLPAEKLNDQEQLVIPLNGNPMCFRSLMFFNQLQDPSSFLMEHQSIFASVFHQCVRVNWILGTRCKQSAVMSYLIIKMEVGILCFHLGLCSICRALLRNYLLPFRVPL